MEPDGFRHPAGQQPVSQGQKSSSLMLFHEKISKRGYADA